MTREEAIKTLKDRIEQYTGGVHPGEREILLEAFAALRGPEWVRTADRLPEAADGITGATGEPEVLTICEHAHGWFPEVIRVSKVVRMPKYYWYWMPLPEPPGVEGEG